MFTDRCVCVCVIRDVVLCNDNEGKCVALRTY